MRPLFLGLAACSLAFLSCHGRSEARRGSKDTTAAVASPKKDTVSMQDSIRSADSAAGVEAAGWEKVRANLVTDDEDYPGKSLLADSARLRLLKEFRAGEDISSGNASFTKIFTAGGSIFIAAKVTNDVCSYSYIFLYRDGHISRCAGMAENCDDDSSIASFEYTDAEEASDTSFRIKYVVVVVRDKKLIGKDGWIKGGKSRDELPTKTDSAVFEVTPSFLVSGRVAPWPKVWRFK